MDKVQHFEIPVKNKERAEKFYSEVFGWMFMDVPDIEYTMIHTIKTDGKGMALEMGGINGGMMKKDKIKNPVITISVENIDEAIERIRKNKGKVVLKKTEIPGMGYSAYVKDTEDNVIGIWENTREM